MVYARSWNKSILWDENSVHVIDDPNPLAHGIVFV
jgi:hypothetical protein